MIKFIQHFTLLFFVSFYVTAGTIVEIQSEDEMTTIMTDGKQAHMGGADAEYVIVTYKDNSVKIVSPKDKEVMLLTGDNMPAGKKAPVIKTKLNKLGSGPVIAGYKTEKFSYTANGKACGVVYGSKDAYQEKGIKELFALMKTMVEKQRATMGGFASMVDDCEQAEMNIINQVKTIGVPMRTEEKGRVVSEVKSIKVNASLPKGVFDIPSSYKTITMQDKINALTNDVEKGQKEFMQQYQPQMQEMMKQMQQSGQMTPEMMEQMRQAQEMMKQYQQ